MAYFIYDTHVRYIHVHVCCVGIYNYTQCTCKRGSSQLISFQSAASFFSGVKVFLFPSALTGSWSGVSQTQWQEQGTGLDNQRGVWHGDTLFFKYVTLLAHCMQSPVVRTCTCV